MVGFGYVLAWSPPAFPDGASDVGITPAANLEAVIVASAIFTLVTEASAIFVVLTDPAAMVGLGYVPAKSPPAFPDGARVVGITPAASLAAVMVASTIFALVTEASAILALVTEASAIFIVLTDPAAMVGFGYVP